MAQINKEQEDIVLVKLKDYIYLSSRKRQNNSQMYAIMFHLDKLKIKKYKNKKKEINKECKLKNNQLK